MRFEKKSLLALAVVSLLSASVVAAEQQISSQVGRKMNMKDYSGRDVTAEIVSMEAKGFGRGEVKLPDGNVVEAILSPDGKLALVMKLRGNVSSAPVAESAPVVPAPSSISSTPQSASSATQSAEDRLRSERNDLRVQLEKVTKELGWYKTEYTTLSSRMDEYSGLEIESKGYQNGYDDAARKGTEEARAAYDRLKQETDATLARLRTERDAARASVETVRAERQKEIDALKTEIAATKRLLERKLAALRGAAELLRGAADDQ